MAGHWIAGSGHESIIKDGEAVGEAMIWGQLLDCLHHPISPAGSLEWYDPWLGGRVSQCDECSYAKRLVGF